MPNVISDSIALYNTLAMPAALLIAAAVMAKATKSHHG